VKCLSRPRVHEPAVLTDEAVQLDHVLVADSNSDHELSTPVSVHVLSFGKDGHLPAARPTLGRWPPLSVKPESLDQLGYRPDDAGQSLGDRLPDLRGQTRIAFLNGLSVALRTVARSPHWLPSGLALGGGSRPVTGLTRSGSYCVSGLSGALATPK
jgi:hypothetical protein